MPLTEDGADAATDSSENGGHVIGELTLEVPQVRGKVEFYPSALERWAPSEWTLKCPIAEIMSRGLHPEFQ
jgi:hypothetical protein